MGKVPLMIVLDVANILHVLTRGKTPGDSDVLELVGWLTSSRYSKQELTLVCDGKPMRASGLRDSVVAALASSGNTRQLLYSGPDQQADDVVEQLLAAAASPAGVLVVSSDRRLRDAARRVGAKSLRSEEFAEHLHDDARRRAFVVPDERGSDHISAKAWAAYFGIDLATGLQARGPVGRSPLAERPGASLGKPKSKRGARKQVQTDDEETGATPIDCQSASLASLSSLHDGVRSLSELHPSDLDMELWLKQFPAESSGKANAPKGRATSRGKRR